MDEGLNLEGLLSDLCQVYAGCYIKSECNQEDKA